MSLGNLLDKGQEILKFQKEQAKRLKEATFTELSQTIGEQATTEINMLIKDERFFNSGSLIRFEYDIDHERIGPFIIGVEVVLQNGLIGPSDWFLGAGNEENFFYTQDEFSESLARIANWNHSPRNQPIGFPRKSDN